MRRWLRVVPVVLLLVSLSTLAIPKRGVTVPLYAARTGLMCQTCHFDPNGGGPRNEFGFGFAKNRHTMEPDTSGEWKDLSLTNRVGDTFPLYFGLNQRFMLLTNQQQKTRGVDRVGFFNMENAIHVTFQPHPKLTLVYSLVQAPFSGFQTKDAFGIIGVGADHYIKVGQFRVPFGLRMDDHTVATRNAFLDYETGESFLPFDPRGSDRGVELGGTHGSLFGRASLTNGHSSTGNFPPVDDQHPQAFAAKLGINVPRYQGGFSFYDDFVKTAALSRRATRWGYYALTHAGPLAFLGEIAAGTDAQDAGSGESRTNKLAYWGEADWAPCHITNLRVRYDRLELDRSSDAAARELNNYNRYSIEGQWVPVPFAELWLAVRLIDPVAKLDPGGSEIRNEKQAFMQVHFSY